MFNQSIMTNMKRTMMMALMAVAATTAFAQDALVKDAKKLLGKGDFDGAAKVLVPALTSSETLDKAAAWNMMSDIKYQHFSKINEVAIKSAITPEPYDTTVMWNSAVEAWEYALKCDEFDQLPDEKGKVKLRYRSNFQNRYKLFGSTLVQAGQYEYTKKNNKGALKAWKNYVDMKDTPIFAEVKDFPQDKFFSDIAYYVAYLSYLEKDFAQAEKYANVAAQDPEKVEEASEILLFAKKDNCKTQADSLAYLAYVKDLHKNKPESERYFNLLVDYYNHVSDKNAKQTWLDEEAALNPNNKMVYAIKGEMMMNDENWDEAVAAFKKAAEIDPTWTPCIFNIGVCLNSKAIVLNDQLMDKKTMGLSKENADKVMNVLREAQTYLEKTRELDPNQEQTRWLYPLYRIYYTTKDKEKMAELEAIDPSLKN